MYQYNIIYYILYLFNETTKENYYKPIEIKSFFERNYIKYKSRGVNDNNLLLE